MIIIIIIIIIIPILFSSGEGFPEGGSRIFKCGGMQKINMCMQRIYHKVPYG